MMRSREAIFAVLLAAATACEETRSNTESDASRAADSEATDAEQLDDEALSGDDTAEAEPSADDADAPSADDTASDDTPEQGDNDNADPDDIADTDDADTDDAVRPETDGPTEEGVRDPAVVVEADEEYSAGFEPRDSTLGLDERGDVRWLFTVENTTDESVCSSGVQLELYDEDGNLLAGNDPGALLPDDGVPVFFATVIGSPHVKGELSASCIAPGERGIGYGSTVATAADGLSGAELLEQAARIEYFFDRRKDGFEPAPELLTITTAELSQTAEGAVVTGRASSGVALANWNIHAALYDDEGKLIDFVSTSGGSVPEGEELSFELPAGSADAVNFEVYREARPSRNL